MSASAAAQVRSRDRSDAGLAPSPTARQALLSPWGALWVLGPIATWCVLRGLGLASGVAADLVTLLVMIPLGGPHVVASFQAAAQERHVPAARVLRAARVLIPSLVFLTVLASVWAQVRWRGRPPLQYLLSGFFLWAAAHVVQQHLHCARVAGERHPRLKLRDALLLSTALMPGALFRMSMIDPADLTGTHARPDALATGMVAALVGPTAADGYLFRIGPVVPVLPGPPLGAWPWIAAAVVHGALLLWFLRDWRAARRAGTADPLQPRFLCTVALTLLLVPWVPELDSAFQGINAWHCWQYLGLHRMAPVPGGRAAGLRAYGRAVAATVALLVILLLVAFFVLPACIDLSDTTHGPRPGQLLVGYYLTGFPLLLMHYLYDSLALGRGGLGARPQALPRSAPGRAACSRSGTCRRRAAAPRPE